MSIIHDALKKAQEQRKQSTTGVPFGSSAPEAKKKPRIALIAIVAVFAAAVAAYLYIPAFHGPKVPPVNRAKPAVPAPQVASQAKPAQVIDSKEAAPQKDQGTSAAAKIETKTEAKPSGATKQQPAVPHAAGPGRVSAEERQIAAKAPERPRAAAGTYRKDREDTEEGPIRRTVVRKTEDELINAQYNEALGAMNSGRMRQAQRIFMNILARRPDHVESLNNLGVIAASLGDKKDALAYFKKVLEHRPNYPKAYNNIGLVMMSDGEARLAEEYFRKAISLEPESLEPYINLSALLRTQKKFQEAAKVLDVPVSKNVKDAMLFLSYAVVKDNMGQSEEAVKFYRQYLALAGSSATRNGVVERLKYLEGKNKK